MKLPKFLFPKYVHYIGPLYINCLGIGWGLKWFKELRKR